MFSNSKIFYVNGKNLEIYRRVSFFTFEFSVEAYHIVSKKPTNSLVFRCRLNRYHFKV